MTQLSSSSTREAGVVITRERNIHIILYGNTHHLWHSILLGNTHHLQEPDLLQILRITQHFQTPREFVETGGVGKVGHIAEGVGLLWSGWRSNGPAGAAVPVDRPSSCGAAEEKCVLVEDEARVKLYRDDLRETEEASLPRQDRVNLTRFRTAHHPSLGRWKALVGRTEDPTFRLC